MKRHATAVWNGSGKEGKGTLTTQSTVLNQTQYSFSSRFEDGIGTNPEELVAAAHAGCFTMKLSFSLDEAGYTEKEISTTCKINFVNGKITESFLTVEVKGNNIDEEAFHKCVKDAEENCPISVLLDTDIKVEATLINA
ncbi:OsmC family peroxiredoxin [Limibacter armeniacum]|uniref:OsmC family peroxiredoxin n=1 Tax=Limibacter armeniacum TaxID=466084 RepID=UPI002FE5F4D4